MNNTTPACTLSSRKQTIAKHFAQAYHYEQHARIQQQTCQLLAKKIVNPLQHSILEVGAGTGQLTRLLADQLQSRHWYINELSASQAASLQKILPQAQILIGDAETMDLGACHSLIVSANAVQWFDNPLNFIRQSVARLASGGQLLFNTFTPNNFLQIKALTGQGLIYPALSSWQQTLEQANLESISLSTHRFDVAFTSPFKVLKHMQLTGVSTNQTQVTNQMTTPLDLSHAKPITTNPLDTKSNTTKLINTEAIPTNIQQPNTKPFRWTKKRLQQFEKDYWQQFTMQDKDGQACVYLTYEIVMINAFKP